MNITNLKLNNTPIIAPKNNKIQSDVAFTAGGPALYAVKNNNAFTRVLPVISFVGAILGSLGYFTGGSALFFDKRHGKKGDIGKDDAEGAKTIDPTTKFGKFGVNATKLGMSAISASGISCGIVEGLPLLTLGEMIHLGSAPIIETPIGTGLFGMSIAAIFAALALDNTPELKVNELDFMAQKGAVAKAKLVAANFGKVAVSIGKSMTEIVKNIYKPSFIKETFLFGTPRTMVFTEEINKDGKVFFSKMLRHNKNYFMNIATVVLALSGTSIIASTLLNKKKAQKKSLRAEEGGFLFDNVGITKLGFDKFFAASGAPGASKSSGASFAVGGVLNAIAQFMGLDNKDGRGLQWVGIGFVFLAYSFDRGRTLNEKIKLAKFRPELKRAVREWKLNLQSIVADSSELKQLQKSIKAESDKSPITHEKFAKIVAIIKEVVGSDYKSTEKIQKELKSKLEQQFGKKLGAEIAGMIVPHQITKFEESKQVLEICTEKIFGSKTPTAVSEEELQKLEKTK